MPPVPPPIPPVPPPVCNQPRFLGWMRSSETFGFVPGARIPVQIPPDGEFAGWNFPWTRENTRIQYFENEEILEAALSGEYTQEVIGIPETIFPESDILIGENYIWDGGTDNQFFAGYYQNDVPGGWASWENVEIENSDLFSPETRENTPGVYLPFHYSLRRFTSYLDLDLNCYNVNTAYLVSEFPSGMPGEFVFPLDDSIFVFVNGILAYWSSTDIIGSGNVAQNRLYFQGLEGDLLNREASIPDTEPPVFENFQFTDGWYLRIGGSQRIADIAPFLRNGKNVIDVIADDYYFGGGMSKINLLIDTLPTLRNRYY